MLTTADSSATNSSAAQTRPAGKLPAWLRWAAVVWLAVYVPAYWRTWGPANFLLLCDIAVFLTCMGLWTRNRLLLSSQTVSSLLVGLTWALDVAWTIVAKHHLIGGTEYMFDPKVALWIRLLSLSHIILPVLLLWVLARIGYDRRAWILQSAIAAAAFVACRFTDTAKNINFAFRDPFFHRAWGPPPAHIAVILAFMVIVVYLPTHLALARLFARSSAGSRG